MLLHKLNWLLLLLLNFGYVFAHPLNGLIFRKVQIRKGLSASFVIYDALNRMELVLDILKVVSLLQSNCLVKSLFIFLFQLPLRSLRWILSAEILEYLSSLWELLTLTYARILVLEVHNWWNRRLLFYPFRLFSRAALFCLISQPCVVTAGGTWDIEPLF